MKLKPIILITAFLAAPAVSADTYVDGYIRSDGTYVEPHIRSSPNNSKLDNYSTRGNTNPYTGERGTKSPRDAPSYDNYYDRSRSRETPQFGR